MTTHTINHGGSMNTDDWIAGVVNWFVILLAAALSWLSVPEHWGIVRDVCVTLSAIGSLLFTIHRFMRHRNK